MLQQNKSIVKVHWAVVVNRTHQVAEQVHLDECRVDTQFLRIVYQWCLGRASTIFHLC